MTSPRSLPRRSIAIGATLAVSTAGQAYIDILGDKLDRLLHWLQGVFS